MNSTAAVVSPYTPEYIEHISKEITAAKTYLVTLIGILCWDTLATFPSEYEFVWKARWTPLKVAFLLNRYWTIVSSSLTVWLLVQGVSREACHKLARIQPGGVTATVMLCAVILSVRVWALFQRNIRLLVCLVALMLAECGVMALATSQFQTLYLPDFPGAFAGCVAYSLPGHHGGAQVYFWSAPLAFDTVIILLTIFRVYRLRKQAGRLRILSTFLADAGFYYSVIFVCDVVNLAFYSQKDPVLRSINSPLSATMTSLMASRIVLHLHASQKAAANSTPVVAAYQSSPNSPFPFLKRPPLSHNPTRSRSFPSSPISNAPISSMVVAGEDLPLSVRVALRGIGKDEMELGLVEEGRVEMLKKEKEDQNRSTSVGSQIWIERETTVQVE